ncbi:MAG: serpin family protein [Candidatus Krumholzibacteriota bacterium]|nr:serpin family protein [Candidatus Krumholzibacteriota bacterium]
MRRPLVTFTLCVALAAAVAPGHSCADAPAPATPPARQIDTGPLNNFAFDLYGELAPGAIDENVFVSPTSVMLALLMTYNGAAGATADSMAAALHVDGLSVDDANMMAAGLMHSLHGAGDVDVAVANSLWLLPGFPFRKDFIARVGVSYDAEVFNELDAGRINSWVDEHTKGRIDRIVDQLGPDDIAVLVNAIWFKGTWKEEFDPALTGEMPFRSSACTAGAAPLMTANRNFSYLENDLFQAVHLPYGDGTTGMYVFLPREEIGLVAFHDSLSADRWNGWMGAFRSRKGTLRLPRFTTEYEAVLNEALIGLGMGLAFHPVKADFSRMCSLERGPVSISEVRHKSFVEVNEEGTEAAAATSVQMRLTSAMPIDPPFEMTVDRPFFFAIRDNMTGAILFMGSIVDPKQN